MGDDMSTLHDHSLGIGDDSTGGVGTGYCGSKHVRTLRLLDGVPSVDLAAMGDEVSAEIELGRPGLLPERRRHRRSFSEIPKPVWFSGWSRGESPLLGREIDSSVSDGLGAVASHCGIKQEVM
jgi:hypothetical protein